MSKARPSTSNGSLLLDEFDRDSGTSFRQHIETHWHPLCDLIMSTSMRTLRQLAPPKEYWVTLYDYLHTPAYRLRLFAPESKDEIEIEITKGPTGNTAYELEPVSSDNLNAPDDIPRFQSRELVLLKDESDWRHRAEHVRTPDGQQLAFKGLNRNTRSVETGQISNTSLDIARDQLKAYEESQAQGESRAAETQRIVGVAIDNGISGDIADGQGGEPKIAGLLWLEIEQ